MGMDIEQHARGDFQFWLQAFDLAMVDGNI
jgi:hypothetical protein